MPARVVPDCKGVYLLTHPRSASNLFQKMMEKQPGHQHLSYKLFDAGFMSLTQVDRGPISTLPEADRQALYGAFNAGVESLEKNIAEINSSGKQAFIKEHALFLQGPDQVFASVYGEEIPSERATQTNPTSLPDEILLAVQPIFQVRHPALMFPSMIRAQDRIMPNTNTQNPRLYLALTLRHSRELYDWYVQNEDKTGRKPRIIEADDVMNNPEAVRQLCLETDLDPDAVQYEWEEKVEENPLKASFLTTINASKGIVKGLDSSHLSIEDEKVKWKKEFGDQTGEELAEYVYKAMPHYEYLLKEPNRVTGKSASA